MRIDTAGKWLLRAEKKANLPKLAGGRWHPYRYQVYLRASIADWAPECPTYITGEGKCTDWSTTH